MIRQVMAQKSGGRFGFLDNLFGNGTHEAESRRDLEFLIQDYLAFNNLAASLSSHSKSIPYHFLVERTKKVADELRGFSEILRAKVADLGGQVPQDPAKLSITHDESIVHESQSQSGNELLRQSVRRLVMDVEEHSNRCETLYHQRNLTADAGTAELLNKIIVDMQRQKDELLDIVMKVS